MIGAYKEFWTRYVDFGGTSDRGKYWYVFLMNIIISIALSVITLIVPALAFLSSVYSLATLIPGLAICVRRLRDAGHHWANIFWAFLPVVGTIILIVFLASPSKE